jgi:hypothetical protein
MLQCERKSPATLAVLLLIPTLIIAPASTTTAAGGLLSSRPSLPPSSQCACTPASLCEPLATALALQSPQRFVFAFPAAEMSNRSAYKSWPWENITAVGLIHQPPAGFVCAAHAHGVRVIQNVGAPRHYSGAVPFLLNQSAQEIWVQENLDTAQRYGLDGLGIDIESNVPATRTQLTSLMARAAAVFRAANPHSVLVASVTMYPFANYSKASPAAIDYAGIAKSGLNFLFVMAYDTFGAPAVAHGGGRADELSKAVRQYVRLGVPARQLILGVGAFGEYDDIWRSRRQGG